MGVTTTSKTRQRAKLVSNGLPIYGLQIRVLARSVRYVTWATHFISITSLFLGVLLILLSALLV